MKTRAALALVVLAAMLALAGVLAGRYLVPYRPDAPPPAAPRVEVAQPTPAAARAERAPVASEACAGLTEIVDADLLTEVARRHSLPDLLRRMQRVPSAPDAGELASSATESGELLAPELHRALLALDQTTERAPWGVEIAATLAPGDTKPTLSVVPRDPPRFAFRADRRLELGLGAAAWGPTDAGVAPALYASFDLRLAQTRRIDHGLRVQGIFSEQSSLFAGYTAGFDW